MDVDRMKDEIVEFLDGAKAREIAVYDAARRSPLLDWYILATGEADRHLQSMGEELRRRYKKFGSRPIEGNPESGWILVDLGACVVHLFNDEMRSKVDLDALWQGDKPHGFFVADDSAQ